LAAAVDKVMFLPQVELLPLAVQAVVAAHKMVLVERELLHKATQVVTVVVAQTIIPAVAAAVLAQLEEQVQIQMQKPVLVEWASNQILMVITITTQAVAAAVVLHQAMVVEMVVLAVAAAALLKLVLEVQAEDLPATLELLGQLVLLEQTLAQVEQTQEEAVELQIRLTQDHRAMVVQEL
jgi:hypothetical protein